MTVSDDADLFTDAGLAPFDAVIFNNTNGRDGAVLTAAQRAAFERYIRAGNGYIGIHAATATDYDWAWYHSMVGATFSVHPAIQNVTIQVDDRVHPSTRGLPQSWVRSEEPYDFRANPRGNVHVLASFDTRSYTGHLMGADHPIAWCQDFEGGRSWYTALGHDISAYAEPLFRGHTAGRDRVGGRGGGRRLRRRPRTSRLREDPARRQHRRPARHGHRRDRPGVLRPARRKDQRLRPGHPAAPRPRPP